MVVKRLFAGGVRVFHVEFFFDISVERLETIFKVDMEKRDR